MAADVELIGYRPELRQDFERLNRIWLEAHALMEPIDLEYLRDPEGRILAGGGQIYFAVQGTEVLGTCAAIRISPATFELAKLSVDSTARGRGLGRRLCDAVVQYARDRGATEVILSSNTALVEALRLYESLGFRHAPLPEVLRYETADVFMRLSL
jgi:GNAT superfamily N-acetyltransferase